MIVVCAPGSRSRRCSSSCSPPAAARSRRTTRIRRPRRCPGRRSSRPSSPSALPSTRRCRASDLTLQGDVEFVPGGPGGRGGVAVIAMRNTGKRRLPPVGTRAREARQEGRAASGQRADPRGPADLPGHRLPTLQPPRPEARRDRRADDHLGELVRSADRGEAARAAERGPDHAARRRRALDADYNAVPPCIDPSSPSTIGVSPFEPAKISRREAVDECASCAPRCPASRSTPGAARSSGSGSCCGTSPVRRFGSTGVPRTSSNSSRAARSRSTN